MLEVIERCFPQYLKKWEPKIREMIPSYGKSLTEHPELLQEIETDTTRTLALDELDTDGEESSDKQELMV